MATPALEASDPEVLLQRGQPGPTPFEFLRNGPRLHLVLAGATGPYDRAMRALVQRVSEASVVVDGEVIGEIGPGVLVFVGVTHDDSSAEAKRLADKIANLRIFTDDDDKMNLSVIDVAGSILVVSQFTLYGDTRKGRRPAYVDAARPEVAEPLCNEVVAALRALDLPVETGRFRADMKVALINDGPVTLSIQV